MDVEQEELITGSASAGSFQTKERSSRGKWAVFFSVLLAGGFFAFAYNGGNSGKDDGGEPIDGSQGIAGLNQDSTPFETDFSGALWSEDSHIPFSYSRSKSTSTRKEELYKDNIQDRSQQNLGKTNDFVRINTYNDRVNKRRQRAQAFDEIRVSYCGEIGREGNNWVDSESLPGAAASGTTHLVSKYAKNTIDYALRYNDKGTLNYPDIRKHASNQQIQQLKNQEAQRAGKVKPLKAKPYKINRHICERAWDEHAPEGYENEELRVTIERLGPFYSHGEYDWNSIGKYDNAASLAQKSAEHDMMYVAGTFFMPVFPNGSLISYPPLHVHHTHLHPYTNKEMSLKIQISQPKLTRLMESITHSRSAKSLLTSIFKDRKNLMPQSKNYVDELEALVKNLKNSTRMDKVKELMELAPNTGVNHHVILQGHGDQECLNEQGGADCVLHLLEPGYGYRVYDTHGLSGNFEINDVRNRKKDYSNYFDKVFDTKKAQEFWDMMHKDVSTTGKTNLKELQDQDDNAPSRRLGQSTSIGATGTKKQNEYKAYVDNTETGKLEFYVDVGIVWTHKKQTETTFLQFGNPPTGKAWMTYSFPLDKNTNMMYYNYTHAFLGPGELSNFILHSHMVYADSIYVFKGNDVYDTLDKLTDGVIPYIFECREGESLTDTRKQEILDGILETGASLVCEGTKPILVLYCDEETDENCVYRDRRIDFNCLEKVRLEEGDTLNIVAFNKVRDITTGGKEDRINPLNEKIDLNNLAISSSFGYSWTAHQHSFFRGDFVSDKAKENGFTKSYGNAVLDILADQYAPPAYFWYGFLREEMWDDSQREQIIQDCPASVSFEAFLPWENLYTDIAVSNVE